MINDMILSKELAIAKMAEAAECGQDSIIQFMKFRQIVQDEIDENSSLPCPAIQVNIVPADSSAPPSMSISSTSTVVNVYVTSNIAVSVHR
jgi:hypothetical protein